MGKIYLEGADNTRDLGGLKTTEGAVIKDFTGNRISFTENSGFKNTNGSRTRARSGSGGSCL